MVPYDAEVFDVVREGTLEMLVGLFNNGSASPFSVDPSGFTLLHVSCTYTLGMDDLSDC